MLKGIDPLLGPDVLAALAKMGHGDEIAVVDANFPATSVASRTVLGTVLRIDRDAIAAMTAILSVLPIDRYEVDPVLTMQVVGAPNDLPEVVAEAMPLLEQEGVVPKALERFAFYARAKSCFAVLQTAEARPYGNFILRKGVITL